MVPTQILTNINIELAADATLGCYSSNQICTSNVGTYCSMVGATIANCRSACANTTSNEYLAGNCSSTGGCSVMLVVYSSLYGLCCQCVHNMAELGTTSFPMTTGCKSGVCTDGNLCGSGNIPGNSGNSVLNAYLVTPVATTIPGV